jgi:hypothetical protein
MQHEAAGSSCGGPIPSSLPRLRLAAGRAVRFQLLAASRIPFLGAGQRARRSCGGRPAPTMSARGC